MRNSQQLYIASLALALKSGLDKQAMSLAKGVIGKGLMSAGEMAAKGLSHFGGAAEGLGARTMKGFDQFAPTAGHFTRPAFGAFQDTLRAINPEATLGARGSALNDAAHGLQGQMPNRYEAAMNRPMGPHGGTGNDLRALDQSGADPAKYLGTKGKGVMQGFDDMASGKSVPTPIQAAQMPNVAAEATNVGPGKAGVPVGEPYGPNGPRPNINAEGFEGPGTPVPGPNIPKPGFYERATQKPREWAGAAGEKAAPYVQRFNNFTEPASDWLKKKVPFLARGESNILSAQNLGRVAVNPFSFPNMMGMGHLNPLSHLPGVGGLYTMLDPDTQQRRGAAEAQKQMYMAATDMPIMDRLGMVLNPGGISKYMQPEVQQQIAAYEAQKARR